MSDERLDDSVIQSPIPYSLFPIPYSLFPIPYSLFPIPHCPLPILLSVDGPVHRAGMRGQEHQNAEADPVPRERGEIVPADVAQQPAYAQECRSKCRRQSDAENPEILYEEKLPVPDQFIGRRGEQDRDGEKKEELGRRLARQSEKQSADDRRAGAGRSRYQRKSLCNADFERVGPAHVLDTLDPDDMFAPFGPQDDQAADDERDGDRHRLEQARLDRATEEPSEHGKRDEGTQKIRGETLRPAIVRQLHGDRPEFDAVFPDHGENGATLDHDLENPAL